MKISDSNISSACMFKETCARLPRTQTPLARAKEGGKDASHGPLRLITSRSPPCEKRSA